MAPGVAPAPALGKGFITLCQLLAEPCELGLLEGAVEVGQEAHPVGDLQGGMGGGTNR